MPFTNISVVRPAWTMPKDEIDRIYNNALTILEEQASIILDDNQLVVRALRPTDLNQTNAVWAETVSATASTGTTYEVSTITAQTIPDDTVVLLYGLYDTSDPQVVTGMRIQSGQAVRAEWDMFPIIGTDPTRPEYRTMYADSPVVIAKNINVEISHYIRAFSPQVVSGIEIVILGLVAEKRGKQIEP